MEMTTSMRSRRTTTSAVAAVMLATFAFAFRPSAGTIAAAPACPAGYQIAGLEELAMTGRDPRVPGAANVCINDKHPETVEDLERMAAQREAIRSAPTGVLPAGAITTARIQKRALMAVGQDAVNSHVWEPVGRGPLQSADPGYSGVNTLGLAEVAGRITSFVYVPPTDKYFPDTLFASKAQGGVWMTDSTVSSWVSIGDRLPSQVVGAVGYTPYKGGTIVALTGDGSFGRYSREGAGAFYSPDGGHRWYRSHGLPDEAFGFKVGVDKVHPNVVYAATGSGLYRSADGARTFRNVVLPTGPCAGRSNRAKTCLLANMVTDVVVQEPGGATDEPGGAVMAAVGWRGGSRANLDGTIQSPANGIYTSATGARGTFTKLEATGLATQERLGRIELGAAYGPTQDHNIVYAVVQDAVLIRKGLPGIDAPGVSYNATCLDAKKQLADLESNSPVAIPPIPYDLPPCEMPTVLNGIYVSRNWGATWLPMAHAAQLLVPGTGSALTPVEAGIGNYAPGVQSWYNAFIKPDPTLTDPATSAPTRIVFGLEEVWENINSTVPQIGPSVFKVIGRYFSGSTCVATLAPPLSLVDPSLPYLCPTNGTEALLTETTTHPDQHDAVFIPTADGVQLVVGNDGGAYKQLASGGSDFSNAYWGIGANRGFNTLLPYDAVRSKDGTVWMGLQDNGTAKIVDIKRNGRVVQEGRTIETKGGDGFFVAVHPENGDIAYGEYVGGRIASTINGGKTWSEMAPPITDGQFSTPFVMDPLDPGHLMIAGRQVVETGSGPGTGAEDWGKVWDLGTAAHPGSADAVASGVDPANSMTALDLIGSNAYVGYCGTCAVLDSMAPFKNGLATNVGGSKRPIRYQTDGWHVARGLGLPNRYITGVKIDPADPKHVWVSLGGYSQRWVPPGQLDAGTRAGHGHIFVSKDAGEHFTDISGDLPDLPVNWITMRGSQVIAATDLGVFVSKEDQECGKSCEYQVLGKGLPLAPIYTVRLAAHDSNLLIAAVFGRGVYSYRFGPTPPEPASVLKPGKPLPMPKFLGKLLASFDFESDAQGWTTRTNNDLMQWKLQSPGSNSSQSFQVTPYVDESSASLISPKMTLPQRSLVKISWDERRDTELCCDFMTLDWSSDGHIWNTVRGIDGQNPDFPQYTNVGFQFVAPAGPVYVRFRLASDQLVSSPPYTGVAVDNVVINY
jgi:hypothetical protein